MKHATASRVGKAGISILLLGASPLWLAAQASGMFSSPSGELMPHGYCYLWDPGLVWLHVISDGLITLSYYAIPVILVYFILKNRDLPLNWIFWMFGSFILACGTTHLMEIWNVWHGNYMLAGITKAVTAILSVLTAAMLIPLVPRVMSMPDRAHLQDLNRRLEQEIAERKRFDAPVDGPLRRRVTVGFIAAVLLTIFIGVSSWRGARRAEQDEYWVSHTHEVMQTIQRTSRHVIEAGTSARAFALSGQESLLTNYQKARASISEDENTLRHLTADNLSQQRRLDVLGPQVNSLTEFAASIIAERQRTQAYPGGRDALEIERLLDVVRATTQGMYAEEDRLLGQRTERARAGQQLTRIIAVLGVLVGATLWVLAKLAVNREIAASSRARMQLSTLNSELESRVTERTAALELEVVERTRVEESVRESLAERERALKDVADQKFALDQHAIVATTDVQGTISYVNDKFCAISKYSREELLGQNHRILSSGHHPKEFFQQMYHTIANGEVWHGEICNRAKDGWIYWVDTTIVPFAGEDGKPRQYMAIRADITERKQAEEIRGRLAAVVDSSDDAIISKTLEGIISTWNSGAEKVFGYTSSEVVGKPMLMLVPPELVNEEFDILARIRRGESVEHLETVRVRKDGTRIDVSATISPVRDGSGGIVGASKIARDITQRRADERKIRQLNEELEQRVVQRTAQLQAANHELEAFTYSVSHDLRAPLRHIGGFSKILIEDFGPVMDPEARRHLERIEDGAHRMGLLVDELLSLARVGRHALNLQPTTLNSVIEEVVSMLSPETEGRAVSWKIANLPSIECDPVLIRQVFQNLLANALKFTRTRERAVIEVGHRQENGQPVIMVRDNGVGFNMKYVDKLFGVFQRLHRAEDFEGTGIGLATVQRIVHKHGGRVWAEAEVDKGATFYFTLEAEPAPAQPKEIHPDDAKQLQVEHQTAAAGGPS